MTLGHSKNNEATQKYCMQGIYSAVMAYVSSHVENVSEIYDFLAIL